MLEVTEVKKVVLGCSGIEAVLFIVKTGVVDPEKMELSMKEVKVGMKVSDGDIVVVGKTVKNVTVSTEDVEIARLSLGVTDRVSEAAVDIVKERLVSLGATKVDTMVSLARADEV